MFQAKDREEATRLKDEIIKDYEDVAPKAMEILDKGFEDSMTVMCLPDYIRVVLRTTNVLERLNRELKRRSDVIQVFPNKESVLRLMGAVTIEYSDIQSSKQRLFKEEKYEEIKEDISSKFADIAKTQVALLKAA